MNSERFSEALEQIAEPVIGQAVRAYETAAKKRRNRRGLRSACAAVLAIVLAIGLLFGLPDGESEIVAAPGILKVYAYDLESANGADITDLEGYELKEGVEFPASFGWGVGMNAYPGLPIKLSVPEEYFEEVEVTFRVTVDGGEFFRTLNMENGFVWWGKAYLGQEFDLENHQTIYWHYLETEAEDGKEQWPSWKYYHESETYAEVVILADGHIVGGTLIRIYDDNEEKIWYQAKVLKSVYYPQINGDYQNVTAAYMKEQMESWKTLK